MQCLNLEAYYFGQTAGYVLCADVAAGVLKIGRSYTIADELYTVFCGGAYPRTVITKLCYS
jgi:hypothetical protein